MPGLRTAEAYWEARFRAGKNWKKFRLGAKPNIGLQAAAMDSYMQRQTRKLEELKKQGKVVTSQNLVEAAHGTGVSYLEQGDTTMYTADNLKKRKNLQHDPRLLQSIERWWQTCMSTTNAETDELPKAEFVELNCRMFKARVRAHPHPTGPNPYPVLTHPNEPHPD